jgi:tRNA dimethylallyltransferase
MGPTASGKTDLAEQLAQQHDCELVSVDSALVYRGLDIGSAKPTSPHHLVDIRDPSESYSAADFADDAGRVVQEICARGKTPLLVGGTMLYFKALLEGLSPMPPSDPVIRAALAQEAEKFGWPYLHQELATVDPVAAARIHPNHSQRLSRALEVYRLSGVPLTHWHQVDASSGPSLRERYRVVQIAIAPKERAVLHERIARRFEQMMAAGLLEEVRGLWQRPDLHADLPAMRAVGYRQLWQHLDGECTLEAALDAAVAATRQLAKRQFTWLRKWPDLAWIYTDSAGNVLKNDEIDAITHDLHGNALDVAMQLLSSDSVD